MPRPIALLPVLLLAACALGAGTTRALPPLQSEGELYVEAQPGFSLQLTAVSAMRGESAIPLDFRDHKPSPRSQRLLAEGRLPPGNYDGLLLDGKDRVRVTAPFEIAPRRAVVLTLAPGAHGAIVASVPARTIVALTAYTTNAVSQDLTIADKHLRQVTGALPAGRGPWGIALDSITNRAYVALEGEDQVSVIDLNSGAEQARIQLAVGAGPREVLLLSDHRTLLCANAGTNSVSFIDVVALREIGSVTVGEEPTSLLPDRRSGRVYVFCARSNSIVLLDPATRSVVATATTDNTPLRGQMDRAGARLYVASTAAQYLMVFTLPQLALQQRVYIGLGTTSIKVDSDTDLVYVANADGRVSIYDPFSLLPVDNFDVGGGATWMAIDAAENVLFLLLGGSRSVAAVQLADKALVGGFDTGADPRVLALMGERN